jgi:hypothetical protein
LLRIDPERKAAINKFIKRSCDDQKAKPKVDSDDDGMLIEGKRSALNSPYELSVSKPRPGNSEKYKCDSQSPSP